MSKKEHDAAVAAYRRTVHTYEKPWYRSSLGLAKKHGLHGLDCLDLCSGNGEFSTILHDKCQMTVTCADYIPLHLDRARTLGFDAFEVDLDADADTVDAVAAGHSGQFDLVVSLAAIEHVFNSDNLLRFAHTVLKPGGLLLVNTPNIEFLGYRIYSLFSGNRPFGEGHHVRFWDFRFLRTNLFLNGFGLVDDCRQFYTVPTDAMARAFRNRRMLSGLAARLLYASRALQKLPFGKGLFTDELTVLGRKDDVPPVGFELNTVRRTLEGLKGHPGEKPAIARLKTARKRRWLDEHLYLSKLVDAL